MARHRDTLLAQAAHYVDNATGGLVPPVHISTTYARHPDYSPMGSGIYSRDENPTYLPVEQVLAALEVDANTAARALLFSSGMAAATSLLALAGPAGHIVAPQSMYYALQRWLGSGLTKPQGGVTFVDTSRSGAVAAAIVPGKTRIVWIETPSNPLLSVSDIRACANAAHVHGALLMVDSTVATPMLTQPLLLGADWVMHSATKYLSGHGDVVAGVAIARTVEPSLGEVARHRRESGNVLGPQDAALHLRVARASSTAALLCAEAETLPGVKHVYYPGLASHPQHVIARAQMHGGYGGLFSIEVHGGAEKALAVCKHLQLFARATSLGSTESLVEHRGSVEGAASTVPQGLLRFSVGLEDPHELLADLRQALIAAAA
jgi:cystathionine gamma-synthase